MDTLSRPRSEHRAARIAALAKLPVFFDLRGRRVVVTGASAGTAWKAELLAAAGAEIVAFAPEPDEEMRLLAASDLPAGSVRLFERAWRPADFAEAALVVADAADESEAARAQAAARRAGVPINVVDRPAFCDFQFGSIVNRSPVVIGICTDGAAPVLGQAIRRRIETMLPAFLGTWTAAAKAMRAELSERIGDVGARRRFWERFAELALLRAPEDGPERELRALAAASDGRRRGRLTIVGAGPGDPEFLTIKALRALQTADVILYDDGVPGGVLELARREAKRMLVGDACGAGRSEAPDALALRLARQGRHVVRLVEGDAAG
ncbi:NAD(P)-dependent oxidoreductase, partial [Propylenella binzhouense]